jgi:predicted dehydrogenase
VARLRVGIIGLGFIGTAKHLPGLASVSDEVEVVGFCDLREERAAKACREFGSADAFVTTDWHDIVNDASLDVVHVCSWNVTHRDVTVAALEAGKHVMCEKPMAVTGREARDMVAAAAASGRKLTVGYQYRFRQDNQFLRNVVDEGRLGEIYHARAHAVRRRGVPTWGVFTDKSKQGGGPLIDIGTHALDLALWYMGNYRVASVTGTVFHKLGKKPAGNIGGPWDPATFEVEDSAFGYIRMKNGATIFLEAAWALNVKRSRESCVTLVGTEGGADSEQLYGADYEVTVNSVVGNELVTSSPDLKGAYFGASASRGDTFSALGAMETKQWIQAIKDDTDPLVLPEQACVVTEILDAIYQSAETGQPVNFD